MSNHLYKYSTSPRDQGIERTKLGTQNIVCAYRLKNLKPKVRLDELKYKTTTREGSMGKTKCERWWLGWL